MHPRITGRPPHAFTLIELLVAMAIIAVLIGLLVPSLFGIYERARKTQAKNDLTQIVNAVNAFYTDYGKYPIATSGADVTFGPGGANSNEVLLRELRACNATTPSCPNNAALNTRQIIFISPRVLGTATARSGIGSDGQYYDPWGIAYAVAIDGEYNNNINPNPYNNGAGPSPVAQGVIAWSRGKDQVLGSGTPPSFTGSDDVISWQ